MKIIHCAAAVGIGVVWMLTSALAADVEGRSDVLNKGFSALITDMLEYSSKGIDPPLDSARRSQLRDDMLKHLEKSTPKLFLVSEKERADFQKGLFDDAGNLKTIDNFIEQAKKNKIELANPLLFIVNSAPTGKLKGAELEAAARFLNAFDTITKTLQERKN